ncbi:uncharacterized protein LOC110027407 isoform X2 [Phalaenopsis equestris]|uniref:uncharacterized protein LOC110027407 isoform X2 n=1 Tax=Phalaenopsis equestris TaxID=78828 RepID=UPI0009E505F1|nr:uncharacterized protein LOC110027407 isoform X2 [Phalaenopsis equestris]
MATDVGQSCYGWSREELDDRDVSREISVSQMLDHGSISFGRFALEPLSWERRSVFTHNRYQEELEKFKYPGLVAQKKAYFEEYYKRIRAMKALQENKHAETASNCDDSSGISGQIMADQRAVPSEGDGAEMLNTTFPFVEKGSKEFALDIDGETALLELDSPAKLSKDDKNGESPPNLKHCEIWDINSYNDEPITTRIVDSGQHDFIRVDNKLVPPGILSENIYQQIVVENHRIIKNESNGEELEYFIREKASTEVGLGIDVKTTLLEADPSMKSSEYNEVYENAQNSKQFQFVVQNSGDHEPVTANIEDHKQHDHIIQNIEEISRKTEKYVLNDTLCSSSSPKVTEDNLYAEQKKLNQAVKGFKRNVFSSEVMKFPSSAGDLLKFEHKTKSVNAILRPVLRDSSQKRKDKNNACIVSHKQTVDRILIGKHAPVASHGSKKEMNSMFTNPRPFTFGTGKLAVTSNSASARYDTKNILPSPSLPLENINSKGVSSRQGIPYSQKREKLENRRGHEPRRQPLYTNREATHPKVASASNVIRPLKARSVNLPPSCKGDSDVGTNSNKIARNNEDGKRKLIQVTAPSKMRDFSVSMKISQRGDNSSLDRRKPRPDKPHWR